MKPSRITKCIATLLAASAMALPCVAAELPNIIIIYADDLGIGDLSCSNSKAGYKTPRLDQMAAEGVRFTDAHSPSTICSPSRYGLFSGQQIYRSTGRGGGAFEGPGGPSYLKPGTLTLGDMLKGKGYHTGIFGKWHVGLTWLDKDGKKLGGGFKNSLLIDYEKSTPLIDGPNKRGFDESFITPNCPTTDPLYIYIENGMVPVPASQRHDPKTLPNLGGKWRWDNDAGWKAPGYDFMEADLLFFDKTRKFITEHRKNSPDKPFFAVLSTQIAHAPVLPAPEFNGATKAGPRGDFVYELDKLVGRMIDLTTELGIDDNTLILFSADNGAEVNHVAWMREDHNHDPSGGWRGVKRDGWEGGHRVPFIARWPGRIPKGQVSNQMTNTTDIFATLASVVGYKLPDNAATDSFDMLPVMLGTGDPKKPIRPHLLTQSFRGEFQIRQGEWKYLDHKGSGGNGYSKGLLKKYELTEKEPEAPGQLYNLTTDPGETTNLFYKNPEKRKELQTLLESLKKNGRSAPTGREPIGIENISTTKVVAEPKAVIAKADPTRPNIVLIISDDQAWGDYGFMEHPDIQTPHLDKLAGVSLTFDRGYVAAPLCRPSLASMATGLYPHQHGVTGNDVNGGTDRAALDVPLRAAFHKHPSVIKTLTANGYLTHQSGKWWEGSYQDGGFTHGMTHGDPKRGGRHGDVGLSIGRKGMKPVTGFIDHAVAEKKPFFLWYAPFLPHTPHNPPKRLLDKYSKDGRAADVAKYYAMCEWFDETCGQLLDYLEEKKVADNTVVLYICDNGWAARSTREEDPAQKLWKGFAQRSKGSPFENGIRTPIMVSWPRHLKPRRVADFAHAIDLFPTIAAAAGVAAPSGLPGVNLLDAKEREARKTIFGVANSIHNLTLGDPADTLQYLWCVDGDWKLLVRHHGKDTTKYKNLHVWDTVALRLYNVKDDPNELKNLASKRPEMVASLRKKIDAWWKPKVK